MIDDMKGIDEKKISFYMRCPRSSFTGLFDRVLTVFMKMYKNDLDKGFLKTSCNIKSSHKEFIIYR